MFNIEETILAFVGACSIIAMFFRAAQFCCKRNKQEYEEIEGEIENGICSVIGCHDMSGVRLDVTKHPGFDWMRQHI